MRCTATTAAGDPCPANATRDSDPPTCPMHGRNALSYQRRGAVASRLKRALPATYEVPGLNGPEDVAAFARELVRLALTEDVDPRRVAEARAAATLALSAFTARTQERLLQTLASLEHGGAAVALLARLQDGLGAGKRRPLPGRVVATLPTREPA